ncbi:MAG: hypothetical protein ACK559_12185, partial [bacterium]
QGPCSGESSGSCNHPLPAAGHPLVRHPPPLRVLCGHPVPLGHLTDGHDRARGQPRELPRPRRVTQLVLDIGPGVPRRLAAVMPGRPVPLHAVPPLCRRSRALLTLRHRPLPPRLSACHQCLYALHPAALAHARAGP